MILEAERRQLGRGAVRDPVKFQSITLKRKLWSVQRDICAAAAEHNHVAIKGCHASGKTFITSGLVPWYLTRFQECKVVTISPTFRQVKLFWEEVALAAAKSKVIFPECSTTSLRISEKRYAFGMPGGASGVALHGVHAKRLLLIVDESPGIAAEVWDALEGIAAGGNVTRIELGNPTVPSGHFYDNFHGRGSKLCKGITISAFDTPNLTGVTIEQLLEMPDHELDRNVQPFLVTRRWVRDRYLKWGPHNPRYQSRVLGQFPTESEHAVFPQAWLERAGRDVTESESAKLLQSRAVIRVGIDVAGPGRDETVLVAQANGLILATEAWNIPDPLGHILRALSSLRDNQKFPLGPILIDGDGIGYHLAPRIASHGYDVYLFRAAASPLDQSVYENAKAECHWIFREWLREDAVRGLNDEEMLAQFDIHYTENSRGRIQIESKDEMHKRGITSSPDRAEACMMAFYPIVSARERISTDDRYEISPV
jgi:phage terminase large subunit